MPRTKTSVLRQECLSRLRDGRAVSKREFDELIRRLRLKTERLSAHREIYPALGLVRVIERQPDYLTTAIEIDDFNILFKRDADILHYFKNKSSQSLYCAAYKKWVDSVRDDRRLSFRNPFPNRYDVFDQVDVWSRTKSLTGTGGYSKHRRDFKFDESKIVQLEYECFRAAPGLLKERKRIWFYGKFPGAVGWSSKDKRRRKAETSFMRVQADKVPRHSGSGYFVELHGYPISEQEAQDSGLKGMNLNFPDGWLST